MGELPGLGVLLGQVFQLQLLGLQERVLVVEGGVIKKLARRDAQSLGDGLDDVGGGVLTALLDVAQIALGYPRLVGEGLQGESPIGAEPADGDPNIVGESFLRHFPVPDRGSDATREECAAVSAVYGVAWENATTENDSGRDPRGPPLEGSDMAKRVLYIDPWTGVSGDMLLGALLDLGGTEEALAILIRDTASTLGLPDGLVEVTRGVQKGVSCTRVIVRTEEAPPLRHLADMEKMIQGAALSSWVKERSLAALRRLAEVEASIHGCTVEEIHFHEVGAADTLIDVVGTFVLVNALGIDSIAIGPIQVGGGAVEIAHGLMGVPAPATARLLAGYPVVGGPEMRELTTPTGALLVGQLQAEPGPLPAMTVQTIGYGGGSMQLDCGPNVLRVVLGEQPTLQIDDATDGRTESVVELQTNLDDISPEVVAHTGRLLREAGALDVWTSLGQGKKDRPVMVLHVLAGPDSEEALADLVFSETGTLGIRRIAMSRRVAERGHVTVEVAGRPLRVKWGRWGGRIVSVAPEYEEAAAVAVAEGIPLQGVMASAREAAKQLLEERP